MSALYHRSQVLQDNLRLRLFQTKMGNQERQEPPQHVGTEFQMVERAVRLESSVLLHPGPRAQCHLKRSKESWMNAGDVHLGVVAESGSGAWRLSAPDADATVPVDEAREIGQ